MMKRRTSTYQLILTFFGLSKEYRIKLFSDIDEIVTYGENYDWGTVYNFPIWLRNFTYRRISDRIKRKNEINSNEITDSTPHNKIIKPPQTNNTYTSKVSNK